MINEQKRQAPRWLGCESGQRKRYLKSLEQDLVLELGPNWRDKILDRSKIGGRHSIQISTSFNLFKFFTFSPSINYDEIWYLKKLSYQPERLQYEQE